MMKRMDFTVLATLAAALLVVSGCSAAQGADEKQTQAAEPQSAREKLAYDATKRIAEAPEGYQPPLSKDTVLIFNAIVRRSGVAVERFDQILPELESARAGSDTQRVAALKAELATLQSDAESAKADFAKEKAALQSRDEYYDETVLAAMEKYVNNAPVEIGEAIADGLN